MKPVCLTLSSGDRVRLNPLHMTTWGPFMVEAPGGSKVMGSKVYLGGSPQLVLESAEQIDWLFEKATSKVKATEAPPSASPQPAPAS